MSKTTVVVGLDSDKRNPFDESFKKIKWERQTFPALSIIRHIHSHVLDTHEGIFRTCTPQPHLATLHPSSSDKSA